MGTREGEHDPLLQAGLQDNRGPMEKGWGVFLGALSLL